jgi:hypothetical protein
VRVIDLAGFPMLVFAITLVSNVQIFAVHVSWLLTFAVLMVLPFICSYRNQVSAFLKTSWKMCPDWRLLANHLLFDRSNVATTAGDRS